MRLGSGLLAAGLVSAAANAQVVITEVDRNLGVNACVFAPPDYPEWCEHDGASNTTTGPWLNSANFGIGAAGGVGYGGSITVAGQQSLATSDRIWVSANVRVEVESAGECGGFGTASTFFSVTFKLFSPARAVLTGSNAVSIGGIDFLLSLQQLDGPFGYIQSDSYDAAFDLEAGEYRYLTLASANGSCSGGCSNKELFGWESQLTFEPLACPADLNGDEIVEDADFVIFVAAYNDLLCPEAPAECPADFNHDGLVDDADFVYFVGAYNDLVCP